MVREKARFLVFIPGTSDGGCSSSSSSSRSKNIKLAAAAAARSSLREDPTTNAAALERAFIKNFHRVNNGASPGKFRIIVLSKGAVVLRVIREQLFAVRASIVALPGFEGLNCCHVAGSTTQLRRALIRKLGFDAKDLIGVL